MSCDLCPNHRFERTRRKQAQGRRAVMQERWLGERAREATLARRKEKRPGGYLAKAWLAASCLFSRDQAARRSHRFLSVP